MGLEMIIGGYRNCAVYAIAAFLLGHLNILAGYLYGNAIGVNLGGGVLPVITSLYLLSRLRGKKTGWLYIFVLVLLLGIGFTYRECNFIPGTGILTSSILLPIITALLVHILAFRNPRIDTETKLILGFACAPLARLIGADLLYSAPIIASVTGQYFIIGGAGICDGLFVSGLYTIAYVDSIESMISLKEKFKYHA